MSRSSGILLEGPLRSSRLSSFRRRDRNHFIPLYFPFDTIAYEQPLPFFIKLLRLPLLGRLFMDVLSEEAQVAFILGVVYYDKTKITKDTIAAYAKPLKEAGAKTALIKTAKLIIPPHIEDIVSVLYRYPFTDPDYLGASTIRSYLSVLGPDLRINSPTRSSFLPSPRDTHLMKRYRY